MKVIDDDSNDLKQRNIDLKKTNLIINYRRFNALFTGIWEFEEKKLKLF